MAQLLVYLAYIYSTLQSYLYSLIESIPLIRYQRLTDKLLLPVERWDERISRNVIANIIDFLWEKNMMESPLTESCIIREVLQRPNSN